MKINWNLVIIGLDKKPVLDHDTKTELKLKHVAISVLILSTKVDQNVKPDDIFKIGKLIQKIDENPEDDFTIEEAARIKKYIGMVEKNPIILMRAWDLLEEAGKSDKKEMD